MENKTQLVIYFLFICVILAGCNTRTLSSVVKQKNNITKDSIVCKNNPSLYSEIIPNLLYKDSLSNVYLRRKQVILQSPFGGREDLSKCQKLPFVYIYVVGTLNDSIAYIKDYIDIKSFQKFNHTNIFFFDKDRVYVFQDSPATYPQFFAIEMNPEKAVIIDSLHIKDTKNVYWKGINTKNGNLNGILVPLNKRK